MARKTYIRPEREYGIKRDCEICGKRSASAIVLIDGAELAVCKTCAHFGKVLHTFGPEYTKTTATVKTALGTEEIVDDYAKIIKKRREELRIPLSVIAERINERLSYLEKVEHGSLIPSVAVARKLEKELGIKLLEDVHEEVAPLKPSTTFQPPTLADILEKSKKKKG